MVKALEGTGETMIHEYRLASINGGYIVIHFPCLNMEIKLTCLVHNQPWNMTFLPLSVHKQIGNN